MDIVEGIFETNVKVDTTIPLASTMRSAIFRCDPFQCEVLVLSVCTTASTELELSFPLNTASPLLTCTSPVTKNKNQ